MTAPLATLWLRLLNEQYALDAAARDPESTLGEAVLREMQRRPPLAPAGVRINGVWKAAKS